MSENLELKYDIYQPFGPSILKSTLPQSFINLLNVEADTILHDEKLSKEHDWSHNLAGNVKKEVAIDQNKIPNFPEFLITMAKQYYKHTIEKDPIEGSKVGFRVWVVSQYAGDFNPMHIHDANLSGVAFLKMPPNFDAEYEKEDHHPTAGCLEFLGSMPNHFARHSYIVKPKVGEFYLFPSWLTHQVYPFRSDGERRSLAFNIHFTMDKPIKGVNV
tara:strand:+ start:87 stop:734 length:648 start_codon:yes stop_codon:yes gene_type:complete